jgi:hypothetical protein
VCPGVVSPDAALTAILARGGSEADLTSWAAQHKPDRSLREEVERLEREGRCDPSVRARLRSDFPACGL